MSARRQTITESERSSNKTRVLIVDDHPMTRTGLAYLINHQPDMTTCCEAQNAAEALEGVLSTMPDLVLTDFTLPDKNGLELIKDIRAVRPDLPILVISMHEESLNAERVLRAGARGYITKEEGGERLMRAIRHVLSGAIYVSDKMSAQILEVFSGERGGNNVRLCKNSLTGNSRLSNFSAKGSQRHQIASRLSRVSMKTVSAHRANIKKKLQLRTTNELIAYAARWTASRVPGTPPGGRQRIGKIPSRFKVDGLVRNQLLGPIAEKRDDQISWCCEPRGRHPSTHEPRSKNSSSPLIRFSSIKI